MSQIFRRSANTLSKVSIFGVLSLVGGLVLLAIVLARSTYVTRQHEFIEQPLQFSHRHHVADAEPVGASFRDDRPLRWIRVHSQASILRSTARRVIGE